MKPLEKIKGLNGRQKVEFIIASALTTALMIALPVYAWFSNNKNLATITKIKEPGDIIIRAGKAIKTDEADPLVNFELKDINIESIAGGKKQRFVFSVNSGDYSLGYDLQLAHTTNIPFTYTLYRATAPSTDGMEQSAIDAMVENGTWTIYTPAENKNLKTYYQKDSNVDGVADTTPIAMIPLNEENNATYGRNIAKQNDTGDEYKCYSQTYDSGDTPQIYAIPVYMQTVEAITHSRDSADSFDYFILELGWDTTAVTENNIYAEWNTAKNNKETDIIYITAKRKG